MCASGSLKHTVDRLRAISIPVENFTVQVHMDRPEGNDFLAAAPIV
jgi:hypothetical protein